jgi:methyl coenzyme M reductase subunit C
VCWAGGRGRGGVGPWVQGERGGEDSKVIIIAEVPKKHQNVRKPLCEISSSTRIHNIMYRVQCQNVIEIEYIFPSITYVREEEEEE